MLNVAEEVGKIKLNILYLLNKFLEISVYNLYA